MLAPMSTFGHFINCENRFYDFIFSSDFKLRYTLTRVKAVILNHTIKSKNSTRLDTSFAWPRLDRRDGNRSVLGQQNASINV